MCDFYYVNKYLIYFGVKFGSTSPQFWNQPVLAGLLTVCSLLTSLEKCLHRMRSMCTSSWSPPPPPAHAWLFTYSNTFTILPDFHIISRGQQLFLPCKYNHQHRNIKSPGGSDLVWITNKSWTRMMRSRPSPWSVCAVSVSMQGA